MNQESESERQLREFREGRADDRKSREQESRVSNKNQRYRRRRLKELRAEAASIPVPGILKALFVVSLPVGILGCCGGLIAWPINIIAENPLPAIVWAAWISPGLLALGLGYQMWFESSSEDRKAYSKLRSEISKLKEKSVEEGDKAVRDIIDGVDREKALDKVEKKLERRVRRENRRNR